MSDPWVRYVKIGNCELYQGDCLAVMPLLGKVDACVTDPPYGIGEGTGTIGKQSTKHTYTGSFDDTVDYIRDICVPAIRMAASMSSCAIVTPGGKNQFLYDPPEDTGIIYQPATVGMSLWGRTTSQPIFFYGRDPFIGLTIQPKHIVATKAAEKCAHPCPKPLYVCEWMVGRASKPKQTILDPFMGSGTTGVACVNLGRSFIGIEQDPDYFDICVKRITDAHRQADLFVAKPAPITPTQEGFDL